MLITLLVMACCLPNVTSVHVNANRELSIISKSSVKQSAL